MSEKPDHETACFDAIRHWYSPQQLVEFASQRHGYANSDGGFGVTYPGDLDDYDRYTEGRFIPAGYVVVNGFWGPPEGYEVFVPEAVYLTVLARVLAEEGFPGEAEQVRALLAQTPHQT
jgi:hypothetical protein